MFPLRILNFNLISFVVRDIFGLEIIFVNIDRLFDSKACIKTKDLQFKVTIELVISDLKL